MAQGNGPHLPPGCCVIHIGPPKTGTTAIQSALARGRAAMAEHGVIYPGRQVNHSVAARAVLGPLAPEVDRPFDATAWRRLVEEVSALDGSRVVVSSEFFSNADTSTAERVVAALGRPACHVVVTVRPLAKILPSAWQQGVRTGYLRTSYENWLVTVLGEPPYDDEPASFAHRDYRQWRQPDVLVERWADVVGADRLSVVVVDESDRQALVRAFEALLGLPSGLLGPGESTNTSYTRGEAELVRQLHHEFYERGWSDPWHLQFVRSDPLRLARDPNRRIPDDQKIRTPRWAAERIAEIGQASAEHITASGAWVVGDLETLSGCPEWYEPGSAQPAVVPAETAMQAVLATILTATAGKESKRSPRPRSRQSSAPNGAGRGVRRP